jgi:hypothetical protein
MRPPLIILATIAVCAAVASAVAYFAIIGAMDAVLHMH